MSEFVWHYDRVVGGGERWKLYDPDSGLYFVTVVRMPGTVYRAYFSGGKIVDASTPYLIHAEIRKHFHTDEIPKLTNRTDREHVNI